MFTYEFDTTLNRSRFIMACKHGLQHFSPLVSCECVTSTWTTLLVSAPQANFSSEMLLN